MTLETGTGADSRRDRGGRRRTERRRGGRLGRSLDDPARRDRQPRQVLPDRRWLHAPPRRRRQGGRRRSFDVRRGEVFGLVGESGCGKSTLGKTLIQLQPPTAGTAKLDGEPIFGKRGNDLKKLRRRMQIIFQDPVGSLNPRMPISDIIGEGLLAQADAENRWGDRKVRDKRVGDYLDAVGLRRDYARRYPHEFSGGQRQRIGIARALALDPDFVVCDEPVSALDVSIQSQILNLLLDLRREFNLTYLFIAHNLSVVQYISDRVGVMYLGKLVELAEVDELYRRPAPPVQRGAPVGGPRRGPRGSARSASSCKGDVPSPAAPPSGCRFHTRCWLREQLGNPENCTTVDPEFRDIGDGHLVACHWAEKVPTAIVASAVPTAEVTIDDADPRRQPDHRPTSLRQMPVCRRRGRRRPAPEYHARVGRDESRSGTIGRRRRPPGKSKEETEAHDTDSNRSSARHDGDPVRGLPGDGRITVGQLSADRGAAERAGIHGPVRGAVVGGQGRRHARRRPAGRHGPRGPEPRQRQQLVVYPVERRRRPAWRQGRHPRRDRSRSWPRPCRRSAPMA